MASKARAGAYEHARAVILVLVGIIIGGFMYFVADKVIYENLGNAAVLRYSPSSSYSQGSSGTFYERLQTKRALKRANSRSKVKSARGSANVYSRSGTNLIDPPTGDMPKVNHIDPPTGD